LVSSDDILVRKAKELVERLRKIFDAENLRPETCDQLVTIYAALTKIENCPALVNAHD
jgi:hypothetical protein